MKKALSPEQKLGFLLQPISLGSFSKGGARILTNGKTETV
jgi:hypothetical protein